MRLTKVHEQGWKSAVLPLQLNKVEFAVHRQSVNVDHLKFARKNFAVNRANRQNAHAVAVFDKEFNTFGTPQVHSD